MPSAQVEATINRVARTLTTQHQIPGLAIAVVYHDQSLVRSFGVTSLETNQPVTADTLFEVGSISKTFTALLGAQVVVDGKMRLDDPVSTHMPALDGSPISRVTLAQLATYNAGGLPLQVPEHVTQQSLIEYLRTWTPSFPAGSQRVYSNPSIGFFGRVAATAAHREFEEMMTATILRNLGLSDTYLTVPASAMPRYAWGHNAELRPVRVNPGVLDDEAYGIKTTANDMCRYMHAQMDADTARPLASAIAMTHQGHYAVGPMTQALGWEAYAYPTSLDALLAGNSREVIFEPRAAEPLGPTPPAMLYNKTGSTGGFAAYVLFVPSKRIGVALVANRGYPIADRITAAYEILQSLDPTLAHEVNTTASPPHQRSDPPATTATTSHNARRAFVGAAPCSSKINSSLASPAGRRNISGM